MTEWFLFHPQVHVSVEGVVERAVAAERYGFTGISFIDHLVAPGAEDRSLWEAMTLATWVAARTTTLRVSHLVLCDAFRHPAVLAKQVATLDHASGGRFELGLGWGSVPDELTGFGVTDARPRERVDRLGATLRELRRLWGEPDSAPTQRPVPLGRVPVVVGGAGPRTLDLTRRYADWWNLVAPSVDRLEELIPQIGSARVSLQHMVAPVIGDASADDVDAAARRRYGYMGNGLTTGDAAVLRDRFRGLADRGVERFYVWFADFAPVETIRWFGESVIAPGVD